MCITIHFSEEQMVSAFADCARAALSSLIFAVEQDCLPYVPYDTGALASSSVCEDADDDLRASLSYGVPYADSVYYGDLRGVEFGKKIHPLASARWFEEAKLRSGNDWLAEVQAAFRGRSDM